MRQFTISSLKPLTNKPGISLDLNFPGDCGCTTTDEATSSGGGGGGGSQIVFWNNIRNRPECILDCNTLITYIRNNGLYKLQSSDEIIMTVDSGGITKATLIPRGTAGTYGSATKSARVTVNSKGVITNIEELDITIAADHVTYSNVGLPGVGNVKAALDAILSTIKVDTFIHTQSVAATVWTVNHNLNKKGSATIEDSSGNTVIGEIAWPSNNQLVLTFSKAISGVAYIN